MDRGIRVHRLYAAGGAGVAAIGALAPEAIADGAVDRAALRLAIQADPSLLTQIEAVIHPLVAQDRAAFLAQARGDGAALAVCDIPLLFEAGGAEAVDKVLVVTAPAEVQRARVLARPGMTEAMFEKILARQMPDAEKRARADFIIDTSLGMDAARQAVQGVIDVASRL
ncbi:MAG: dephospho-CoA kinase [Pseudomonadota bacterium]